MNEVSSESDNPSFVSQFRYVLLLGGGAILVVVIIAVWFGTPSHRREKEFHRRFFVALNETIERLQIPTDQKTQMVASLEQVKNEFQAGRVSEETLKSLRWNFDAFAIASELLAVDDRLVRPSTLSVEEKKSGARALQRMARQVIDYRGSVDDTRVFFNNTSFEFFSGGMDGKTRLLNRDSKMKDKVDDEILRRIVRMATEKADAAGIPDKDFSINFADEFDAAVARAKSKN